MLGMEIITWGMWVWCFETVDGGRSLRLTVDGAVLRTKGHSDKNNIIGFPHKGQQIQTVNRGSSTLNRNKDYEKNNLPYTTHQ